MGLMCCVMVFLVYKCGWVTLALMLGHAVCGFAYVHTVLWLRTVCFGMINMKLNCWEFKKCGRHVGGEKVKELGVCPVASERRTDGINGGRNAGRCCWAIAGTLCGGVVQGSFATKAGNCMKCDFYKLVHKEEGSALKKSSEILSIVRH